VGCLAQRLGAGFDVNPESGQIAGGLPADWITPSYRRGWAFTA